MINPTELTELENLEALADNAILKKQKLNLQTLSMEPWYKQLTSSEKYPKPERIGEYGHVYFICTQILPKIFSQTTELLLPFMRNALLEGLRNAFENGDELGETDISIEYSDLSVVPVEFIIHSSRKEISPHFAKYWKFIKKMRSSGNLKYDPLNPDMSLSFYRYSGIIPQPSNQGMGLVVMLSNTGDCGFYRSPKDTLITRMVFDIK